MINNINILEEFISKYPSPKLVVTTTIKEGYVSCIGPVKTLFGPEIHATKKTIEEVRRHLNDQSK